MIPSFVAKCTVVMLLTTSLSYQSTLPRPEIITRTLKHHVENQFLCSRETIINYTTPEDRGNIAICKKWRSQYGVVPGMIVAY